MEVTTGNASLSSALHSLFKMANLFVGDRVRMLGATQQGAEVRLLRHIK